MILSELSGYLREVKRAPLVDLANRWGSDPAALRGMLAILERKGRVRKLVGTTVACSSNCGICDPASIEVYEWIEHRSRD